MSFVFRDETQMTSDQILIITKGPCTSLDMILGFLQQQNHNISIC